MKHPLVFGVSEYLLSSYVQYHRPLDLETRCQIQLGGLVYLEVGTYRDGRRKGDRVGIGKGKEPSLKWSIEMRRGILDGDDVK